jgi:hypothetical protein
MSERFTSWRHRHGIKTGTEVQAEAEEIGRRVAEQHRRMSEHGVPVLGTQEARERIRARGVPLDEYVVYGVESDADRQARWRRRDRERSVWYWAIGVALAALFMWGWISSGGFEDRSLPHCDTGAVPCIEDGTVYGLDDPDMPAEYPISPYAP